MFFYLFLHIYIYILMVITLEKNHLVQRKLPNPILSIILPPGCKAWSGQLQLCWNEEPLQRVFFRLSKVCET